MKKSTERRKARSWKGQQRDYGAKPISKAQAKFMRQYYGGTARQTIADDVPLTDDDFFSPFEGG